MREASRRPFRHPEKAEAQVSFALANQEECRMTEALPTAIEQERASPDQPRGTRMSPSLSPATGWLTYLLMPTTSTARVAL